VSAVLLASGAPAADPPLAATMQCDRAASPGRVKCSIEARAAAGRSLAWADVTVVEVPSFAAALKGRIGPADVTLREPSLERWAFGLVARAAGQGEAKARVRAVVCAPAASDAGAPACAPIDVEVRARVIAG
jgi:hypothetical protein